jgi:hypothetical protein
MDISNLLKRSWTQAGIYHHEYGQDDARCDFFIVFSLLNLWALIQLDGFLELLNPESTRIAEYMKLTPCSRIQFLLQYDTINRACYCTKVMFDVENFLSNVTDKLGLKPTKKYSAIIDELSRNKVINNNEKQVLTVPAKIRNTLHNNGYAGRNFKGTVRGVLFNFKEGELITNTGWHNLYIVFDELVNVLTTIIESPSVQRIPKIPNTSMSMSIL